MEAVVKDISYSVRGLIKRPGFTGLIVLVLALAIAASSSIFSIANAVMLKPLSFKDPNQLVWIWATRKNVSRAFFSIPNFSDTNKQNHTLAEVAPLAIWGVNYGVVAGLALVISLLLEWLHPLTMWQYILYVFAPMPLVSMLLSRYAKALFLAMDHYFDPHVKTGEEN